MFESVRGGANCNSRFASSGFLVTPSMKRMKRSPYGSGRMGDMNFVSWLRPSVIMLVQLYGRSRENLLQKCSSFLTVP